MPASGEQHKPNGTSAPAHARPRESAARRGYGHRWRKLRLMVLARQPECARCGAPATDVDHITARAKGGSDAFENLEALCHSCHSKKTAAQDGGFGRDEKSPAHGP